MAADMFIAIDGIPGESQDAQHKGEIDVLSFTWGMTQDGSFHHGSGGGAGKVSINDLSFSKFVDLATPLLMLHCSNGEHIPECRLTIRKAGKLPLEYIIITMRKCMITAVQTGESGGGERVMETVSINFAQVEFKYTQQKEDGTKGIEKFYKWDIAANKQL